MIASSHFRQRSRAASGLRPSAPPRSSRTGSQKLSECRGLRIQLAERRPSSQTGELHGLYEADEKDHYKVSLWMRTAQRQQVVKFKTFLRTMLHELGHHLDYQKFRLRDSFHTEGFYRRESSLFRQLFADEARSRLRPPTARM